MLTIAAILQILLRDEALAEDVDIDHLAGITDGFSGSDLKREWLWQTALTNLQTFASLPHSLL